MSQSVAASTHGPGIRGWLIGRPLGVLLGLDAIGVALGAAAVGQLGNPDVLLHVVWIVLAVEAFTFGLRVAAIRILIASLFVIAYGVVANGDSGEVAAAMIDLDMEEWPLMAVIAIIVAIMADRVTGTGRRYAALYRTASDRLLTAQEVERRRLASDLHDGVGQTLTALVLTLDSAEKALAQPRKEDAPSLDAVQRARALAGMALEETRSVAFRLRPARLREGGLVPALRDLAAGAGVRVEFTAEPKLIRPGLIDPDKEIDVYRIVQEAIGNASRHAHARSIRLAVSNPGRMLRLEVADDGIGFDVKAATDRGLGLTSMEERAGAVHGTLEVRSRPGGGTVVRLDVPLSRDVLATLGEGPLQPAPAGSATP
jgi:signal transduction histidine kinase